MWMFVKLTDDSEAGGVYRCVVCSATIAYARSALEVDATSRHSRVNPAGVLCEFLTFHSCINTIAQKALFREHSWFTGYGWRFLHCSQCLTHIGWRYDAFAAQNPPFTFFGVLAAGVTLDEPQA